MPVEEHHKTALNLSTFAPTGAPRSAPGQDSAQACPGRGADLSVPLGSRQGKRHDFGGLSLAESRQQPLTGSSRLSKSKGRICTCLNSVGVCGGAPWPGSSSRLLTAANGRGSAEKSRRFAPSPLPLSEGERDRGDGKSASGCPSVLFFSAGAG
jgi:hypothetical protein